MARILRFLVSLFWRLVLCVLFVTNFVRFCLIFIFGNLSAKVVRRDTDPITSPSPRASQDETSPFPDREPPGDGLYFIAPCWDLDDVVGEESVCPRPSIIPPTIGKDVTLKLIGRAQELLEMFLADENQHSLERANHLLGHLVPLLSEGAFLAVALFLQSHCRLLLFGLTEDTFLLDKCIEGFQNVLALQAWDVVGRRTTLALYGTAFGSRYTKSENVEDLDRAIELYSEVLAENMDRPPSVVTELGELLLVRHRKGRNGDDLDDAIRLLGEAHSLLGVRHPLRPSNLNNLAIALTTRHASLGSISDLEDGITHNRQALLLLARNHHDRPGSLYNLSKALVARYKRLRDISDMEEAIVYHHEALSLISANHPLRQASLTSLASALLTRYKTFGGISDVEEAIILSREALSLRPDGHPFRSSSLNDLASALVTRYKKLGNISDLQEAIVHNREALLLLTANNSDRSPTLNNLGNALAARYRKLGDIADLEDAIVYHREALLSRPGSHPLRASSLTNLASDLLTLYEELGKIHDLEDSIAYHREALSLRSSSHPSRTFTLNNLAGALHVRYGILGSISDLEEAIIYHREALSLRPSGHPDRPKSLCNLACVLDSRFSRSGSMSDLQEGISFLKEALSICHPDSPGRTSYMFNLAILLSTRYEKLKDVEDLDDAVRLYEECLTLEPRNHPGRPITLEGLGRALLKRARNESDIAAGMSRIEESLSLLSSPSPTRQMALLNYLIMSSRLNNPPLDSTILRDRCVEVAKLTPPEHPDYSAMTSLIGPILHTCYASAPELLTTLGLEPNLNAEDATLALLRKGSRSLTSPSRDQLQATCLWIILAEEYDRPRTLEMYELMLEHLDLTVARGCSLDIRRQELAGHPVILDAKNLVPDAVAFAIEQGAIERAVEFLERGRSILLAQLSLYRVSSGLETDQPDLARRFDDLSWQAECATFTEGKGLGNMAIKLPFEDPISRSDRLRREWEKVVEEIRTVDGFERFLRPAQFADLRNAAAQGPVVLINISGSRSDAIIVTSQRPPIVVPLPAASPERVTFLVDLFKKVALSKLGNDIRDPLLLLWEEIVEPIVSALEQMPDVAERSRIWWCLSGAIMTLPLHAAGDYRNGRRLPDLYVSSYIPTLAALSRARQARTNNNSSPPSFLLVGQSNTPNLAPLPAVPEEIVCINNRFTNATVLEDEQGTSGAVLSGVKQHRWVHLACHGKVRPSNPLESHFALYDGPLSLFELMQNRLPDAQLAFLSCCHSASGDSNTPDEFLHLAAGMQFAGFKSVVGTMWAMNDAVGPKLADEFYRVLLGRGKGDYRKSAKALNDALKLLRRDKVPLEVWINFVHWGA